SGIVVNTEFLQACFFTYSFFYYFTVKESTDLFAISLHDALPIFPHLVREMVEVAERPSAGNPDASAEQVDCLVNLTNDGWFHGSDRKSTRLNSSHVKNSYAVFCLKKNIKLKY